MTDVNWYKKQLAEIDRHANRVEWARSFCRAVIFWNERHPEPNSFDAIKRADIALDYLAGWSGCHDFTISRDKKSIQLNTGRERDGYLSVTAPNWPTLGLIEEVQA